jgi:hypothetical protein
MEKIAHSKKNLILGSGLKKKKPNPATKQF